jgi:unsaturated chondroitin disaccharide hydrolase
MKIGLWKAICLITCCSLSAPLQAQNLDSQVIHGFQFAEQQLENSMTEIGGPVRHPRNTLSNGKWNAPFAGDWTCGFFSGCLWFMYEWTRDDVWRDAAQEWTAQLEGQKHNAGNHDVGFRIMSSFGNGYRLTGRSDYKDVVLTAAETLATRYNDKIGCIRSWNGGNYLVIIDNMMNLELLFWASKNGGSQRLYDMAVSHAEKTMESHVRADGSTYHVVDFNNDGTVNRKYTAQGFSKESTWSRGQAWGLYGFTMTYRETGDKKFLNTAVRLADYFVDNIPADYVPYSDFEAPNIPNVGKDSSAAAIACSALFELDGYVQDDKYRNAAQNILVSLSGPDYLAEGTKHSSILHRGSERYGDVEKGLVYGDYYFMESMLRWENRVDTPVESSRQELVTWGKVKRAVLLQNYPNPFNPETWIPFVLGEECRASLQVYNSSGNMIRAIPLGVKPAGSYIQQGKAIYWDGRGDSGERVASGVYFYQLRAGHYTITRKMVMLE